jgi:hypothetical protein
MSSVEQLLVFYASKNLTIDRLAYLSEDDWAKLPGLDGVKPLDELTKMALRAEVRAFVSKKSASLSRPSTALSDRSATASSNTRASASSSSRAENEAFLKAELERSVARPTTPYPSATASSKTRAENEALKAELARLKARPPSAHLPIEGASSKIREELKVEKAKRQKLEKDIAKVNEKAKVKFSEAVCTMDRLVVALRDVQQIVNELIHLGSSLDICFCIDATGSMASTISSIKECIVQVALRISQTTGMDCRFALVVYRDYCDGALRHQTWDFNDSSTLEQILGTVIAGGGGDGPEDCFGGLLAAVTQVSWKAPSKVIVWMGDAPQHGEQYNGGMKDDYPEGDPDGVTSTIIFENLQKKGIILVFCKLTDYTNTMIARLRLELTPFDDSLLLEYNIGGSMSDFLANALHKTAERTHGSHTSGTVKPFSLTPATWDIRLSIWGGVEACKILTFKPFSGGKVHPLLDLLIDGSHVKSRDGKVFITHNPVAKGEMRLAYYCREIEGVGFLSWKTFGVAKESLYLGTYQNSKEALKDQANIQAAAQFLAEEFTLKLSSLKIYKAVKYVPVELLRIPSRPRDKQYFSLEPFIEGDYIKFNNNNGYVNKELEAAHSILQTFSHFTYCYSRGLLMVTDIQGAVRTGSNYTLTDPAIHTIDPKHLPDKTNLGARGMAAFFRTHACNEFCRSLRLKKFSELDASPMEMIIQPNIGSNCMLQ